MRETEPRPATGWRSERGITIFPGKVIGSSAPTDQAAPPPAAQTTAKAVPAEWDIPESFRRARTAISGVTKDFEALHRRARSLVKTSEPPAK